MLKDINLIKNERCDKQQNVINFVSFVMHMGIVAKQSIYNSIASYLGIIIGAINTIILFPNIFTPDQFGLTRVLGSAAILLAMISSLGVPNIALKFFPFFRDKKQQHNGFLFVMILIPFIGYIIVTIIYFFFKENIISYYSEGSSLFRSYFNYIAILAIYMVYFSLLDAYLRVLFKTVLYAFLENVVLRILWMILIILYYFKYLNFDQFIFYYVNVYVILLAVEIFYIIITKEFFVKPNFKLFNNNMVKKMVIYGAFVIFGASSTLVSGTIDILMVGALLGDGLANVAFYTIALYIAIVIMIPYESINRIAATVVSEAWKNNDDEKIKKIYKQTSNNLMLIGTLLFLGIWLNSDSIFKILPESYAEAKYVLLFICIAKLYDVSTGINATIIQFSSFFKLMLYFNGLFILLLVSTNLLLIPEYGIEGAAIATLVSVIVVNTIRLITLRVKLGVFPFVKKSSYILIVGGLTYLVVYFIPIFNWFVIDVVVRSSIIVLLYVPAMYFLNVSEEFNSLIDKTLVVIKLKK
ncbi:MAG: oligosaccharide flippase family protein [Flavobacteriales bacterium]|nr:oligosaccharide flippase family protein [Flavobacteriales bacterium]